MQDEVQTSPSASGAAAPETHASPDGSPTPTTDEGVAMSYYAEHDLVSMIFAPSFELGHWEEIEAFTNNQFEAGRNRWCADLTAIEVLSSRLFGLLIGLNARICRRGGKLNLKVRQKSKLAELLTLSRIQLIIDVEFV